LLGYPRSAGTAPGVGPPPPNKLAMPTQQRVRADEQRLPTRSPKKLAGRSKKDTVGLRQTRTSDLAAKNRKLVPKHNDLKLLELARTHTQRSHHERTPKQQIHQRHEHGQTPSTGCGRGPTLRPRSQLRRVHKQPDGFTYPTGLALLLAPPAGRGGARLVVVSEAATRTIALPLHVSARSLDKSVLGGAIGLAVNREAGNAYLVEPAGRVLDVNLASRKVSVFEPPLRKPAAAAKGPVQSTVQALWLGRGVLAVTGVRRMASGRLLPLGLWLTNTRSWRSRLVDPMVTGMAYSGSTVLGFQPFFDQLGAGTTAIGLRGYSLGGLLRFRAFAGKPITVARVQGRYAYAAGTGSSGTSVVDVGRGPVEPPHPDAISISPSELLAGPGR
jgi:hypothetical protein